MADGYTIKDPHFEITCADCRYGDHSKHQTIIAINDGIMLGTYRCACTRCRYK